MMKMIQAMVRPEKEQDVVSALEKAGFYAFTRFSAFGRGRQRGMQAGPVRYEELSKVCFMLAVEADEADRVVDTVRIAACTGNPGDGKVFISALREARSIRKGG
ncbi:MAG: P-II family nitrogen regulator [Nitrospiria bacterium]